MFKDLDEYYEKLMKKVLALCDNGNKRFFYLDFTDLEYHDDPRIIVCTALNISLELNNLSIANKYYICYDERKILYVMGDKKMKVCFTIEIPYGSRSKYLPAVKEINALLGHSGLLMIAADNNPYHFQSLLLVETNSDPKPFQNIIDKYNLSVIYNKGLDEISCEIFTASWNTATISGCPDTLEWQFNHPFLFAEEEALSTKWKAGTSKRKKLFISYCHKDKPLVNKIVDDMKLYGLDVWIDKEEIDVGDSIIEKVHSGIAECDLAILFISTATIHANFAKHELQIFANSVVYKEKNWFIIKIDDVNVNDILYGLSDFLYYDLNENPSSEELVKAIRKKLKKI